MNGNAYKTLFITHTHTHTQPSSLSEGRGSQEHPKPPSSLPPSLAREGEGGQRSRVSSVSGRPVHSKGVEIVIGDSSSSEEEEEEEEGGGRGGGEDGECPHTHHLFVHLCA